MQRGIKNLSTHLDQWIYAPNRPSRAMIQISNFWEDEIVSMFYACGLHVLCIVPMLIIHPHIFETWCWWRQPRLSQVECPYLYATWHQKLFYASWPLIPCTQSAIMCHDLNFKFWRRRGRLHVERFLHSNKIIFYSFNH